MNDFSTIESAQLESISGGRGGGRAVANGLKWAWENVGAPMLGGAAYEAISDRLGGRSGQQPSQPSQPSQPPSQGGQ